MPWLLKLDKDDFVGKWAAEHVQSAACASGSSASRCRRALVPLEGAQVVRDGRAVGPRDERALERAARTGDRPRLGRARPRRRRDARSDPRVDGALHAATVTLAPFYDPDGSGCARERASPSSRLRRRDPGWRSPPAAARSPTRPSPTSRTGSASSRCGATCRRRAAAREQLLPLGPERGAARRRRPAGGSAPSACAQAGLRVYDLSAALAALEFEGETLLRRLTELDPDALPAAGSVAARHAGARRAPRRRPVPPLRAAGARPLRRRGRRRPRAGARPVKDLFRVRRMWRPQRRAQAALRRRRSIGGGSHGLATAYYLAKNHGVRERRRARAVLHRLRRLRPQHDDHPLELPHARGRRVLRAQRRALRAAVGRARLQPHVLAARPPDARALRPLAEHDAGAGRGEPAARDRLPRRPARRDRPALPAARPLRRARPGRSSARSTTPPGGIIRHDAVVWGFARGADRLRGRDPPVHAGDRDRADGRPRHRPSRRTAAASRPASS